MSVVDRDAQAWLAAFAKCAASGKGVGELFAEGGFWRDYLPFGWTLQTLEGRAEIEDFALKNGPNACFNAPVFEGSAAQQDGFFTFKTKDGSGRGHIRVEHGLCTTLFTMLDSLSTVEQPETDAPYVLIVGGGQGGLALGAQLSDLGVPYLIVDKYPRVGDQWRSRYESLILHDPVWYDHMPFKPFPPDWPVFTPKDMMGDWLETYATDLDLSIWTSTEFIGARYDDENGTWTASVRKDGREQTLTPTHIVMALGLSGFPNQPEFSGQDRFRGPQMHSSAYNGGAAFEGQDVIVVGANNSAHDIAADLVRFGARPTMIQRSSTLVVRQEDYCDKVLGPLYSAEAVANGITTDRADILQAAVPFRLMEERHKLLWDDIRADGAEFYAQISDAGFKLDFAEDGTGLGAKYRRTASGYYIDVGAAAMVMDGRIGVRSGSGIDRLSERRVMAA